MGTEVPVGHCKALYLNPTLLSNPSNFPPFCLLPPNPLSPIIYKQQMSLFADTKAVELDTNAFIGDIRSDIEATTDTKAQDYNFDFYRERPLKQGDDSNSVHFEWLEGDWETEASGRASNVSQSTQSTLRRGREEEEDLEEGSTAVVPTTVIRRRPSD